MKRRTKFLFASTYGILLLGILLQPALQNPQIAPVDRSDRLDEEARFFEEIRRMILDRHVDEPDSKALLFNAIEGMLDRLDHARFYPPDEAAGFREEVSGAYVGIGLYCISRENRVFVETTLPDAPSADHVAPGDELLEVEGRAVSELDLDEAYGLMRGAAGSTCVLKIRSAETGLVRSPRIVRRQVRRPSITASLVPGTEAPSIGYVRIRSFQQQTARVFTEQLKAIGASSLAGLILDLRGNKGGVLDSAVAMANLFIPEGVLVRTRGRDPELEKVYEATRNRFAYPDVVLAILIDGESASAAEVLAGVLQDMARARLVGTDSYGKGVVQVATRMEFMNEPVVVKFPVARYYLPSGRSIGAPTDSKGSRSGAGLAPDLRVPLTSHQQRTVRKALDAFNLAFTTRKKENLLETMLSEDPQLDAAIRMLQEPY